MDDSNLLFVFTPIAQVIRNKLHPIEIKLVVLEHTLVWLVESNRDDPATVALLKGRYRQVEEPVTKLVAKVAARQVKLYDIVTVVLKPEVNLEKVEEKVDEFEQELNKVEPVSAKYDVAMAVQQQHEVSGRMNNISLLQLRKPKYLKEIGDV